MLMSILSVLAASQAANSSTTATPAAPPAAVTRDAMPRLADELFGLLGTANADIDAFVAGSFSPAAGEVEPASVTLTRLKALARDSGGVDLTESETRGQRTFFSGFTRKGRVPVDGMLAMKDGKIFAFEMQRDVRARTDGAPPWPMKAQSAADAVEAISRELEWRASVDRFSGAVLVAHRGKPVLERAFGLAERSPDKPNQLDTLFTTASTTKMLTSAAVARLIDQGKVSFDTTVAKAVPAMARTPGAETVTIRDLLGHRVSYGEYFEDRKKRPELASATRATDLLPLLTGRTPERAPKGEVAYSNANYLVLAAAIEAATGKAYSDYIRSQVLRPLGMARTTYGSVAGRPGGAAKGWIKDDVNDPLAVGPWQSNDDFMAGGWRGGPAGGVWSTAGDMWRLVDGIAAGKLIAEPTLRAMLDDRLRVGPTLGSALGFMTRGGDRLTYFGHAGGGGNAGMSTAAFISPDREWAVVVLSNFSSPAGEMTAGQILDHLAKLPRTGSIAQSR